MKDKEQKAWILTMGFYPGVLFGFRSYEEKEFTTHVLYIPFVDFAIEIEN